VSINNAKKTIKVPSISYFLERLVFLGFYLLQKFVERELKNVYLSGTINIKIANQIFVTLTIKYFEKSSFFGDSFSDIKTQF
jgi:hypothetical protein